ncbi:hypothetical protein [Streptomyces sp. NPDC018031]|uniref:hypothetical protein n=1 Tax=Streptomyces sp. NPDC018031 TaxID=3365033 RepID=UPI0037A4EF0D
MTGRWVPPEESTAQRAGRWWDAVRVPASLGGPALDQLGEKSGPVIIDGSGSLLYWLVEPGSATGWHIPQVQVLGDTDREVAFVGVPSRYATRGRDLHWHRPVPPDGKYLTDTRLLHDALAETAAELTAAGTEGTEGDR